jgi:UPF0716 protein FxsA
MLLKLFLAFTLIPIIELYLLIEVGTIIGTLNTVILVIATGFAGAWLARLQGMQTMIRVRSSLQQGIMPYGRFVNIYGRDCTSYTWFYYRCSRVAPFDSRDA